MRLRCADTAERVQFLLAVETLAERSNILLDEVSQFTPPHRFGAAFTILI